MKKRILIAVSVATLGLASVTPAVMADEPSSTPIVAACEGSSGYDTLGRWYFQNGTTNIFSNCMMFSADDRESPGTPSFANLLTWFAEQGSGASPVALGWGNSILLTSAGDPCADGTISGQAGVPNWTANRVTYNHGFGDGDSWDITWTASFTGGIGELTGTAERTFADPDETPNETRALRGTIVLEDPCNPSEALVELVLS